MKTITLTLNILLLSHILFSCKSSEDIIDKKSLTADFLYWHFNKISEPKAYFYLTNKDWISKKVDTTNYSNFVFDTNYIIGKSKTGVNYSTIDIQNIINDREIDTLRKQSKKKINLKLLNIKNNFIEFKTEHPKKATFLDIQKITYISTPLFTTNNKYCFFYINTESLVNSSDGTLRVYEKSENGWNAIAVFNVSKPNE